MGDTVARTDQTGSTQRRRGAGVRSTDLTPAGPSGSPKLGGDNCSNCATPGQGGEQLLRFLRLVWEVSIVHNKGFFLQVEDLDPSMFDDGSADLLLLMRFGTQDKPDTLEVTGYQNVWPACSLEDGKVRLQHLGRRRLGTPCSLILQRRPSRRRAGFFGFCFGIRWCRACKSFAYSSL